MANIKSQLKRIKTNEKARQRNKATKSALKTSIRRFRDAADSGDTAKASELAYAASRALDKAASKGIEGPWTDSCAASIRTALRRSRW